MALRFLIFSVHAIEDVVYAFAGNGLVNTANVVIDTFPPVSAFYHTVTVTFPAFHPVNFPPIIDLSVFRADFKMVEAVNVVFAVNIPLVLRGFGKNSNNSVIARFAVNNAGVSVKEIIRSLDGDSTNLFFLFVETGQTGIGYFRVTVIDVGEHAQLGTVFL